MEPPAAGHKLDPDGGERLSFSGADFVIRASAETTGGAFSIVEEISPLDTPLHVHENEDEFFYVLEGKHVFQCGDDEFEVGPGGLVFAPRRVPHSQRRKLPRTGRILTMVSPAGFEGFFRELAGGRERGLDRPGGLRAGVREVFDHLAVARAVGRLGRGKPAARLRIPTY